MLCCVGVEKGGSCAGQIVWVGGDKGGEVDTSSYPPDGCIGRDPAPQPTVCCANGMLPGFGFCNQGLACESGGGCVSPVLFLESGCGAAEGTARRADGLTSLLLLVTLELAHRNMNDALHLCS